MEEGVPTNTLHSQSSDDELEQQVDAAMDAEPTKRILVRFDRIRRVESDADYAEKKISKITVDFVLDHPDLARLVAAKIPEVEEAIQAIRYELEDDEGGEVSSVRESNEDQEENELVPGEVVEVPVPTHESSDADVEVMHALRERVMALGHSLMSLNGVLSERDPRAKPLLKRSLSGVVRQFEDVRRLERSDLSELEAAVKLATAILSEYGTESARGATMIDTPEAIRRLNVHVNNAGETSASIIRGISTSSSEELRDLVPAFRALTDRLGTISNFNRRLMGMLDNMNRR
jgi:hypothetical protein